MILHAKLSASGSARWINCAGSVKAEEGYLNTTSIYADWGTHCHELSEICLSSGTNAAEWIGKNLPENNAIEVDYEMADCAQSYVDYVRLIKGEKMIEQRVDFSPWVNEGFGTSDAIVIDDEHMHVIDLKAGKGITVEAESNTQAILYALGALNDFGLIYDIHIVTVHIVQPRLNNYSEWTLTKDELLKWGERIKQAADAALEADAPRTPGEKQCQWCKAKAKCPALMQLTENVLMSDFEHISSSPRELSDAQLKLALDTKKLITAWLDAVEDIVKERIENNQTFEGYKIVEGRSNRTWSNEDDAQEKLVSVLKDEMYETKFISVAKAEKLLGKTNAKLLEGLVVKSSGAPTLVPESDKRVSLNEILADFV
jgi:hypothetical protein